MTDYPERLSWSPEISAEEISGKPDHLVLVCRGCEAVDRWRLSIDIGSGLGLFCGQCGLVPAGRADEWQDFFRNWTDD